MSQKDPKKTQVDTILSLFSSGHFQDALDSIEDLFKDFSRDPLLNNIAGACYAGLDELSMAVSFYNKAISLNPKYSKAYHNLAGTLYDMGRIDDAIFNYKSSIELDPNFSESHNNLGNIYRELGHLDTAVESYQHALSINPSYAESSFSLANVFQEMCELESAIKYYKNTLELKPDFAEAYNSLGMAYKELGQLDEAIICYEKAISLKPDFSQANNNLGNAWKELGDLDNAVNSYRLALAINPDFPSFHINLGNAFREHGQLNEALESYYNALKHNPDYAESHNNIGLVFFELGQIEKSIESYRRALSSDLSFADAHNNLGVAFNKIGKLEEAISSYKEAISLKPYYVDAFNNLGVVYKKLGQLDEAVSSYESALDIKYDDANTHNNLGIVFVEMDRLDEAINSYNNAIKINPELSEAHNNLGHVLSQLNSYDKAIEAYERGFHLNKDLEYILGNILSAKMNSCNWINLKNFLKEARSLLEASKNKIIDPFSFMGLIDDPALQRKATEIRVISSHPKSNVLPKIEQYPLHNKIRIGYFSGDFREHPVGYLTAGLYESHNRELFEVHAFSLGPDTNDALNLRIKEGVDHFHDVHSMPHKEIALLARSLEIDIAVDLAGLTAKSKTDVFAMSAAPIQLSYIGYLGTMGVDYYDYLIADQMMIPKKYQKHYVEKIVYLPSFQVNDSKDLPPDITLTRKEVGLPDKGFVFCCFNNTYKFTPTTFDSWAKILKAVDDSVLIVFTNNELSKTNLTKEIEQRGVEPGRLIFGDSLARPEYMARYRVADLFLDTQPYNAGTTASDALRMGLPLITLKGKSYQARMGASILNSINLPELITNTPEDYEALAIELASNPEKLKIIKDKLANNLSTAPLYDTKLFTQNLESAFTTMYERYHKGLKPDHIYVE